MSTIRKFKATVGVNDLNFLVGYKDGQIDYLTMSNHTGEQTIRRSIDSYFEGWIAKLEKELNMSLNITEGDEVMVTENGDKCNFNLFNSIKGTVMSFNKDDIVIVDFQGFLAQIPFTQLKKSK